jgi:hypothetical protein
VISAGDLVNTVIILVTGGDGNEGFVGPVLHFIDPTADIT